MSNTYTVERLDNDRIYPKVVTHLYSNGKRTTTIDATYLYGDKGGKWWHIAREKVSEKYARDCLEYAHVLGKAAVASANKFVTEDK